MESTTTTTTTTVYERSRADNRLKAYVRYDGNGRVVPSSIILRRNKPQVGDWVEVLANLCCNPTTTSTTTINERN